MIYDLSHIGLFGGGGCRRVPPSRVHQPTFSLSGSERQDSPHPEVIGIDFASNKDFGLTQKQTPVLNIPDLTNIKKISKDSDFNHPSLFFALHLKSGHNSTSWCPPTGSPLEFLAQRRLRLCRAGRLAFQSVPSHFFYFHPFLKN